MKRCVLSLLLALCFAFSVLVFSSCDKGGQEVDAAGSATEEPLTDPSGTEADTAEATTADKWEKLAPKVTMIAQNMRNFKIECSSRKTAVKESKNDIYLKGPDEVIDGVTPAIEQMVYQRNQAANKLLGTSVEFEFWDLEFNQQMPQIDLVVKGKTADAPDLFVNMLNDISHEMLEGSFKDVWSIPNSFFDFSAPGWLKDWMENLSFTGDRAYILGSDYFMDIFRAMSVLPFNRTLMDKNSARLEGAILEEGETLGEGETITPRFFDLVDRGEWTWDVLGKLCEAIWVDGDGDGQDSIRDQLGLLTDSYGGDAAAGFVYTCGLPLTEDYRIEDETSKYNNGQWIKYADDSTMLNLIFNKVKSVFDGRGSFTTAKDRPGNTPDNPGLAYHYTKFANGEVLFIGSLLLGALENDTIQGMRDLYSVVPCPKADKNASYNTIIYNSGDVGAINVNVKPVKAKALSAYLQYCTEHSGAIREQFLQIVMKYKVTTYDQGTDRMLDIMYENITWTRDYIVEGLNMDPRWHGEMRKQQFTVGADFITTLYQSYIALKQKRLDDVMKTWYTLPKTEN